MPAARHNISEYTYRLSVFHPIAKGDTEWQNVLLVLKRLQLEVGK
jgi:hypothetical protein